MTLHHRRSTGSTAWACVGVQAVAESRRPARTHCVRAAIVALAMQARLPGMMSSGMLLSRSRSMTKPGALSMPFAAQQAMGMASGKAAGV